MSTHSALVPKRKAVGPGPFGLATGESDSANLKCMHFVDELTDALTALF